MVIQEQILESKKYVVVKNHVREVAKSELQLNADQIEKQSSSEENTPNKSKINNGNKKLKRLLSNSLTECDVKTKPSEISESDLEELRTLYKKCKTVLKKIETKYGDVLNLDNERDSNDQILHFNSKELQSENECYCGLNKKIVFDEEGKQIFKESNSDIHICIKRPKIDRSTTCSNQNTVEIEIESEFNKELPDNLIDLCALLKKPDIQIKFRRNIINKIKSMRQENLYNLRFDKQNLINKVKINPDEIMEFKGANLSTLAGYHI